jgi:cell wall-associated NlpC family hydrolase
MNILRYIGIPYVAKGRTWEGGDCWNLVRLFYKTELNIEVPSYVDTYIAPSHSQSVAGAIDSAVNVTREWKEIPEPEFGCVLVFDILGFPVHTGIYLGDNDFLHAFLNTNSCIERLNSITWNRRLQGCYTWAHN